MLTDTIWGSRFAFGGTPVNVYTRTVAEPFTFSTAYSSLVDPSDWTGLTAFGEGGQKPGIGHGFPLPFMLTVELPETMAALSATTHCQPRNTTGRGPKQDS